MKSKTYFMENFDQVLKLLDDYDWIYFFSNTMRKNKVRRYITMMILFSSLILLILFLFSNNYIFYFLVVGLMITGVLTVFVMMNYDYKFWFEYFPYVMRLTKKYYVNFRFIEVAKQLNNKGNLTKIFIDKLDSECDLYIQLKGGSQFLEFIQNVRRDGQPSIW